MRVAIQYRQVDLKPGNLKTLLIRTPSVTIWGTATASSVVMLPHSIMNVVHRIVLKEHGFLPRCRVISLTGVAIAWLGVQF